MMHENDIKESYHNMFDAENEPNDQVDFSKISKTRPTNLLASNFRSRRDLVTKYLEDR